MSTDIQQGSLVLADIAGYTSYLAGVELDHAHEILTDLLETIIDCFKPVLTISKLEGDAVFAYVPDDRLPRGESLLELIESTYVAFRDRRQAIQRRTTCTCNACRNIPSLDLKFIVHHGDYLLQKVRTIVEPIGSDVNLAHRLMKNGITDATGWRAYAIFTRQACAYLGLLFPQAYTSVESYDHLGPVEIECVDLHARYDQLSQVRRVFVTAEQADKILEFDYEAAPPVLWEWFNDPAKRSQWMHARILPILRVGGRVAAGARNHCVHGKNEVVVEDILDIKPFDYFTVEHRPQNSRGSLRMTFEFIPLPGSGTRLRLNLQWQPRGLPRWATRFLTSFIVDHTLRRRWSLESIDALIQGAQPPPPEAMPQNVPEIIRRTE